MRPPSEAEVVKLLIQMGYVRALGSYCRSIPLIESSVNLILTRYGFGHLNYQMRRPHENQR